jgi:nucleoside-diphosphate-sugar epimerase
MRVLVTGSSGHVGGAIAAHLVAAGHTVVGLSRQPATVEGLAEQVLLDIGNTDASDILRRQLAPCDALVHAAASLDPALQGPGAMQCNCGGVQQMLAVAHSWPGCGFVFMSSVPVIGRPLLHPITEDHPTNPATAYHASKLLGEHLVQIAAGVGMAAASLRLPSPIGPGTPNGCIFSVFVDHALRGEPLIVQGNGSRRQSYVDVRDVARAVEACLDRRCQGLLQIAGRGSISNLELARLCVQTLDSTSPVHFSGTPDPDEDIVWDVSIEKAHSVLGYEPRVSLTDSIMTVAAEYADCCAQ